MRKTARGDGEKGENRRSRALAAWFVGPAWMLSRSEDSVLWGPRVGERARNFAGEPEKSSTRGLTCGPRLDAEPERGLCPVGSACRWAGEKFRSGCIRSSLSAPRAPFPSTVSALPQSRPRRRSGA
jgi:hypothetical protein